MCNRPYALTSRLHNNDAMLGVKTCRAARTCFAGRAHWRSPSQSVCAPGPARRWGMQGFALWVHAWRWCTWRASFDPQHHGGALLWRHMHMVYYTGCKICNFYCNAPQHSKYPSFNNYYYYDFWIINSSIIIIIIVVVVVIIESIIIVIIVYINIINAVVIVITFLF